MRRVAVAMSGGVDSSVAALLLKRQGYSVEGVYMMNWSEMDEMGQCPSQEEYLHVTAVCRHIGIPCHRAEFVQDYWNEVFSGFLQGIRQGHTPNPDILCNEKIKFGVFQKYIFGNTKACHVATGHYAQLETMNGTGDVRLMKAVDGFKDQTYFLSTVSQDSLRRTLFPVGHLTKSEVRQIALEAGLYKTVNKKESMGLCFIGKRRFPYFIQEYIEDRTGLFLSYDGHVMGRHKGHHYYTIGQRARLGGMDEPWFVCGKDPHRNTVTIVKGQDNPLLYCHTFTTGPAHWIRVGMREGDQKVFEARYRHQQDLFTCHVQSLGEGLVVQSRKPLRAVTPGQYAVFYDDKECMGGAYIKMAGTFQ